VLDLLPGAGPWEVELGFGKGRYLLRRAAAEPSCRFLGVERAARYFRLTVERARRRGIGNLLALRGDALFLLTAVLPRCFARAVHVYFPDPWPKTRHHRRRLFHPETLDLVVGLLEPGGLLHFASDHPEYGPLVAELLRGYPAVEVKELLDGWEDGPRTNYEAKYLRAGRPIVRLVATRTAPDPLPLHSQGRDGVLTAYDSADGSLR
jgi:tRNA (guanine-N7-)-methyltransferase